jgi:hypothetical protein
LDQKKKTINKKKKKSWRAGKISNGYKKEDNVPTVKDGRSCVGANFAKVREVLEAREASEATEAIWHCKFHGGIDKIEISHKAEDVGRRILPHNRKTTHV